MPTNRMQLTHAWCAPPTWSILSRTACKRASRGPKETHHSRCGLTAFRNQLQLAPSQSSESLLRLRQGRQEPVLCAEERSTATATSHTAQPVVQQQNQRCWSHCPPRPRATAHGKLLRHCSSAPVVPRLQPIGLLQLWKQLGKLRPSRMTRGLAEPPGTGGLTARQRGTIAPIKSWLMTTGCHPTTRY